MHRVATVLMTLTLTLFACTGDDRADDAVFAVDTDHDGQVDCSDLDHVLTCIAHPDLAGCGDADVNGDGTVDDADAHDLHDGLAATGHDCADPDPHDTGDHPDAGTHDDGHADAGGH